MNDTESFEHAMAEMRKVVVDCDMERCDMYDDDCYKCQNDILDRMQRAYERELEHVRKAEYARGYHDRQRSMDARHYAVALRLQDLTFDGGSHENLSKIAYALYPCATGWTCESCDGLRDELVRLLGGVHEGETVITDEARDVAQVELPTDKHGRVYEVGDTVRVDRGEGGPYIVRRLVLAKDGWKVHVSVDQYHAELPPETFVICDDAEQDTAEQIIRDLTVGRITECDAIKRIEELPNG